MFRIRNLLAMLVFVSSVSSARAPHSAWAAGELDPGFGSGGIVLQDLEEGSEEAREILVLPDGRLLVFGHTDASFRSLVFLRYLSDGTLDASFGVGGVVLWNPGAGGRFPSGIALAHDGGILVTAAFDGLQHLARFDADGNLDLTFATAGIYSFPSNSGGDEIAVAGDGDIFVSGVLVGASRDIAVWKLDAAGALDSGFGSGGMATLDTGLSDQPEGLSILPDGKIVVGGTRYTACCISGDPMVARFLDDGAVDTSFGTGGWSSTPIGRPFAGMRAFAVQPDGKLVVGGFAGVNLNARDFALARFEAEGAVDTTLGTSGVVITDFGGGVDDLMAMVVEPSGRIVAAGWAQIPDGFALVAYRPNGTLDASFGSGGKVSTTFYDVGSAVAYALALTPGGTLTAAGYSNDFEGELGDDITLARYGTGICGNGIVETGEDCDDSNTQGGDCCSATCSAEPVGQPCGGPQTGCSRLTCSAASACVVEDPAPRPLCKGANHARLSVSDRNPGVPDDRDRLSFSWSHGETTDLGELGDPDASTTYTLCGYDISNGLDPELLFEVEAPAGGTCFGAPCWKSTGNGFKYRDPERNPSGMDELLLKAGPAGRGRMKARARGVFLDVAPQPFALPAVVQLVAEDGACWQGSFVAADVTQSSPGRFRAHASH